MIRKDTRKKDIISPNDEYQTQSFIDFDSFIFSDIDSDDKNQFQKQKQATWQDGHLKIKERKQSTLRTKTNSSLDTIEKITDHFFSAKFIDYIHIKTNKSVKVERQNDKLSYEDRNSNIY
ncbi:hypothetical protein CDIK_3699 [Cucumispora dikerogammari]|nr:hypothetical protein CDIK_3699 [Cucumispora dikerogammari]